MKVDLFDFDLPEEAIALRPAVPRDTGRMLQVSSSGELTDYHVNNLPSLLRAGDVLVLNDTRVIRASLRAIRPARPVGGGGDVSIDVNLHKRLSDSQWRAFVRPAKRLKADDEVSFGENLSAKVLDNPVAGEVTLDFDRSGDHLDQAIEVCGDIPLPPYIGRKRDSDDRDETDYQTVYANEDGSVAAPTAGLHFTPQLFGKLKEKGIQIEKITLHVGAGTFLPVKSDVTNDHHMHSETFHINAPVAERINQAKADGQRIIAVGTTALRALESASQNGELTSYSGDTNIFITPGYKFKIVDGLMTNFHLPRSTLFMLVSAFCGLEVMQKAYAHAIETGYRFYSYGDSSLLWKAHG